MSNDGSMPSNELPRYLERSYVMRYQWRRKNKQNGDVSPFQKNPRNQRRNDATHDDARNGSRMGMELVIYVFCLFLFCICLLTDFMIKID